MTIVSNSWINYNGRTYPLLEAIFPVNRAMSYGDGLFESIRIHEGEILFFDEHIERMLHGMKALKMLVPDHFDAFFFHKQILDLAVKEKVDANARIRINIFRSGSGLYEPNQNTPEYFLQVMPLDSGFIWREEPFEIGVFSDIPKNYSAISFFKSMNALPYVMAGLYRSANQLDDCVLLNTSGKITDAVSSNIFWFEKENVYTTPLADGCVDGVMRKHLIKVLSEKKYLCLEKSIVPASLISCDEIFITNVGWGIQPVTKFAEKIFTSVQTKEVFHLLMDSLSK